MENALTQLLDAIIPKLDVLLSDMRLWMGIAMICGPILLLLLGLFYLFLSPADVSNRIGYRTFFGMGSVTAWRATQKLAGMVYGGAGAVLTVVAVVGCVLMNLQSPTDAMTPALIVMIIEAAVALLSYLAVEAMVLVRYFKMKK